MKKQIVIAGPDMSSLAELSLLLDKSEFSVFLVESRRPTERLLLEGAGQPEAMVIYQTGDENVVDLRKLLDAYEGSRILFLALRFPPHPAEARIINQYGATVLRHDERPLFIIATLIALMTSAFGASA